MRDRTPVQTVLFALLFSVLISHVMAAETTAKFTQAPIFKKDGAGGLITFEADADAIVEVAIIDAGTQVVRHLAAGKLGSNAPEPFQKNARAQRIVWDGLDDAGQPAQGGPFQARVRLGMRPKLDRNLGRDARTLGAISALGVGPQGELFVVLCETFWGRSEIRVYSREGKYLRTILPYSAATPPERTESVGHFVIDGERIPVVFNGHSHNLSPLVAGLQKQTMAFHPDGWVALFSGVGSMADQGAPRHLLALHPEGGAPKGQPFVGPQLVAPRNFLGSAGDARSRFFDHAAFSPDGQWVYVSMGWFNPTEEDPRRKPVPRHAVYRLRMGDEQLGAPWLGEAARAGEDDAHFNDPQGLATDAAGNLYVCDRGNHRLLQFSSQGQLTGRVKVEHPTQVYVHRTSGEMYVLCQPPAKRFNKTELVKFAAFKDGAAAEKTRVPLGRVDAMALDDGATPPKLWCAENKRFFPVVDAGDKLVPGEPVGDNEAGLEYPMFVDADPARGRVIVRERSHLMYELDMDTGKLSLMPLKRAYDVALDRDGNLYVMDGYGKNSISRYTPDGKPLPFKNGQNKLAVVYRSYGPNIGMRGLTVAPGGDVYVLASTNYGKPEHQGGHIHVFAPDGTPKKQDLVPGLAYGDCGLGVDARGNVYVGVNIKPEGHPLPADFAGKASTGRWLWWKDDARVGPWRYTFCNPYLFYNGCVVKFPPAGGAIYGHDINNRDGHRDVPTMDAARAPDGAKAFRSSYLGREVRVAGAAWAYQGVSPVPGSSDGPKPDPGCVCFPSHLDTDPYGRVYAPNVFRFGVEVLDAAGNRLMRVGRYGNADDPEETLPFAWPGWVSWARGKLYVSDAANRRVTVVGFAHDAEALAALVE